MVPGGTLKVSARLASIPECNLQGRSFVDFGYGFDPRKKYNSINLARGIFILEVVGLS